MRPPPREEGRIITNHATGRSLTMHCLVHTQNNTDFARFWPRTFYFAHPQKWQYFYFIQNLLSPPFSVPRFAAKPVIFARFADICGNIWPQIYRCICSETVIYRFPVWRWSYSDTTVSLPERHTAASDKTRAIWTRMRSNKICRAIPLATSPQHELYASNYIASRRRPRPGRCSRLRFNASVLRGRCDAKMTSRRQAD